MELNELKRRYSISQAWTDLGLPGKPGRCVSSPFRDDAHPSFSVWRADDGTEQFKDHATGDRGDVFDFVATAQGCNTADAVRWVKSRLGIAAMPKPERKAKVKPRRKLPDLRNGTPGEHKALISQRGFSPEALKLAEQRGLLHFTKLWDFDAWAVTDRRRELVEFRRLDGQPWPAYGRLAERKSHANGSKRWPLGVLEAKPFNHVLWTEGAPDFIAAHHFAVVEGKQDRVGVVTILGASNTRLDEKALTHLAGKHLLMFPHADEAGRRAVAIWANQLKRAGARSVLAFDLSGIVMTDGSAGKDLCDLIQLEPDCWENTPKFRGKMLP